MSQAEKYLKCRFKANDDERRGAIQDGFPPAEDRLSSRACIPEEGTWLVPLVWLKALELEEAAAGARASRGPKRELNCTALLLAAGAGAELPMVRLYPRGAVG